MKTSREPPFKTEAEMCAAFIDWVKRDGFRSYPETGGFDILCVNEATGHQIGVQAKLRLNFKVLDQLLPRYLANKDEGPDHYAVLVPQHPGDAEQLLAILGVVCFYAVRTHRHDRPAEFSMPGYGAKPSRKQFFDWNPKSRVKLPDYIPDVAAGAPCPIQLTPWKINALRLLARLELHGPVMRREIATFGMDSRRWCGHGAWLVPAEGSSHAERNGRWIRGPLCPRFDEQHPDVYAQIKAELAAAAAPPKQAEL